jgi:hypothetical protein
LKERSKGREEEKEEVSKYRMNIRKREDIGN